MKKTKFIFGLLIVTILAGCASYKILDSQENLIAEAEEAEIKEIIHGFLEERASVIISDENVRSQNFLKDTSAINIENSQREEISKWREDLKKKEEIYSKIKTEIEIKDIKQITELKVVFLIKEETYLKTINKKETGYSAYHEFIVEKSNKDQWQLIEDRQLEPNGLLPLGKADQYMYDGDTYFNIP